MQKTRLKTWITASFGLFIAGSTIEINKLSWKLVMTGILVLVCAICCYAIDQD